jgi:hypothetical protein
MKEKEVYSMKKIMLFAIVSLIGSGMIFVTLGGEGKAPKKGEGKAQPPALEEITLTGKVEKSEKKVGEKSVTLYTLTDANGNVVNLPPSKDNPPKYNLDDFVGENVKVVGQGITRENKKTNKKEVILKTITTIEEVKEEKANEANP